MPTNVNHEAHDYAEQFRAKLPRHLQELREGCGLSKYALEQQSGVSREMIGKIERGLANPTFCLTMQLTYVFGLTLVEFAFHLEGQGTGEKFPASPAGGTVTPPAEPTVARPDGINDRNGR